MAGGTLNHGLEVLLKRLQKNDREALADLYAITSAHLYAIVFRILKDETKASDILKQVYLHIWNTRHDSLPEDVSALNALRAIAHRKAIDGYLQTENASPVSLLPEFASEGVHTADVLSFAYSNALPADELTKALENAPEKIVDQIRKNPTSKTEAKK